MEKLGVEMDDEKTKQASREMVCESCGKSFKFDPAVVSEVQRCPHCFSTKNFEKRP
jgi:predicted Zn-ribbon and HTH transcriptional regulator